MLGWIYVLDEHGYTVVLGLIYALCSCFSNTQSWQDWCDYWGCGSLVASPHLGAGSISK